MIKEIITKEEPFRQTESPKQKNYHNGFDKTTADAQERGSSFNTEWESTVPTDPERCVDIVSSGTLRQKDFSLVFDNGENDFDIPVKETDTINVYSNTAFDSGTIKKAFANGITINIFSESGGLLGRFIPASPLKSPAVTFEMLETYYSPEKRVWLAKRFLLASLHNTRLVIRYYNKQNPSEVYTKALGKINGVFSEIKAETEYDKLIIKEARARQAYYSCYDSFISDSGFSYDSRTRRPPRNEFNAMISFGNTLLYNFIATEINKTPLDVRIGFLHATNKRRESLNLDIAEIFKPLIVDRTVLTLINKREISLSDFTRTQNGVFLNGHGKRIFIGKFREKLDATLMINGRNVSYRNIICGEIQNLIRFFKSGEEYKAFRQVR